MKITIMLETNEDNFAPLMERITEAGASGLMTHMETNFPNNQNAAVNFVRRERRQKQSFDEPSNTTALDLFEVLKNHDPNKIKTWSRPEILAVAGCPSTTASNAISRLVSLNMLKRVERGQYKLISDGLKTNGYVRKPRASVNIVIHACLDLYKEGVEITAESVSQRVGKQASDCLNYLNRKRGFLRVIKKTRDLGGREMNVYEWVAPKEKLDSVIAMPPRSRMDHLSMQ